jgi:hypothetical protein
MTPGQIKLVLEPNHQWAAERQINVPRRWRMARPHVGPIAVDSISDVCTR